MYIKECLGTTVAFGYEGNEKDVDRFENLCYNYSIANGFYRLYPSFCYVLTSPSKLLNGLSLFLQNKHFADKDCQAYGLRILSIQEAKRFIEQIKDEPFYTRYIHQDNMTRDNWEDSCLCYKITKTLVCHDNHEE